MRKKDLLQAINECNPEIIDFSGHGDKCDIVLESDDGKDSSISREAVIIFISVCKNLQLVIFNVCKSKLFAKDAVSKIDFAIGMDGSIGDSAAINFAYRFYSSIGFAKNVDEAFEQAKTEIALYGYLKYVDVPKLYIKENVKRNRLLIGNSKKNLENVANNDKNSNVKNDIVINVNGNMGQINFANENSKINTKMYIGILENIK